MSVFNSPAGRQLAIHSCRSVLNRASDVFIATDWLSQITNGKICGNFSRVAQMWFLLVVEIPINHPSLYNKYNNSFVD